VGEYSYLYAVPYLLLTLFYLVLARLEFGFEEKGKNTIRKICMLLFLFFFGLRGFVGWDYTAYYPAFLDWNSSFSELGLFSRDNEFDIGFSLYVSIIRLFTNNFHVFIFVSALIDLIFLNVIIKRFSLNYALSFALFLAFNLGLEIDLLRNVKSVLLFIVALEYLKSRQPLKYFLLIFVAVTFHWTAVIYLPLYFFLHKKLSRSIVIAIVIIGNIVFFTGLFSFMSFFSETLTSLGGVFELKQESYFESGDFTKSWGFSIGYFERLFTVIIILIYYEKLVEQRSENILFINLYIIYISMFLYLSDLHVLINRFSLFFSCAYWVLIPALLYLLDFQKRRLFFWAIVVYCILKILVTTNHIYYKYDNLLFGIERFENRLATFYQYFDFQF
jgi:hypothetical protein